PASGTRRADRPARGRGLHGGSRLAPDSHGELLRLPGDRLSAASGTAVAAAPRHVLANRAKDLSYTLDELAFQREVRTWLKQNVPKPDRRDANPVEGAPDKERIARAKAWQRKVHAAGYLAMGWPKEYGGQGADVMRQTIVNEEMVRARAPGIIGMMGIQMVGPALIGHGTEQQR